MVMYKFDNKTVVITGGAGGIGYAIAENFLQKCVSKVIIIDINEKLGISAADTLKTRYGEQRVIFYKGDVTTDLDILYKEILRNQKTVDILINCAGISDEALVENIININFTAVLKWSMKFYEHMRVDKFGYGGTIINISSILGYQILPCAPVYHATKFATLGFGKSMGHIDNFNKFGVRVITLCPGFTETNLINPTKIRSSDMHKDHMDYFKNITFQKPDVVGKATVDVFVTAESGTVWEIANSCPLVRIS